MKNRIIFFDRLRVVAAFAVIVLHCCAQYFHTPLQADQWITINIYDSLTRWSVPIFFMISGALFLNPDKQIDIKKLYSKNILRIIIAFLFWSFIYAIPYMLNHKGYSLILSGPFHFWFLKTLIGLYIMIPIFKIIVSKKQIEEYFILISFIAGSLFCFTNDFIGTLNTYAQTRIGLIIGGIGIKHISVYCLYFVLGHYLTKYSIEKYTKYIYLASVISFILVPLLTHIHSCFSGEHIDLYYSNSNPLIVIESIAVYLFFMKNASKQYKTDTLILRLSKYSFGIFIVHILVMNILNKVLGIVHFSLDYILYVPLYSLLTFIISGIIIAVLHKIPFVNRWLI